MLTTNDGGRVWRLLPRCRVFPSEGGPLAATVTSDGTYWVSGVNVTHQLVVLVGRDEGAHWHRLPYATLPPLTATPPYPPNAQLIPRSITIADSHRR